MDHSDLDAIHERLHRAYQGCDPMQIYLDNVTMLADLYYIRNMLGCADGQHPTDAARALHAARLAAEESADADGG